MPSLPLPSLAPLQSTADAGKLNRAVLYEDLVVAQGAKALEWEKQRREAEAARLRGLREEQERQAARRRKREEEAATREFNNDREGMLKAVEDFKRDQEAAEVCAA